MSDKLFTTTEAARLVPAQPTARRLAVADLADVLARMPSLAPGDGDRFEKDVLAARRRLRSARDPWR